MKAYKLYMILLGCKPVGRHTEQHDIFFGVGASVNDLIPDIKAFWAEAAKKIHIDAWREVTYVDGHAVSVIERGGAEHKDSDGRPGQKMFFINLGGYKENQFDEAHYKMLVVSPDVDAAKAKAKRHAFYLHAFLPDSPTSHNAGAHIDDKYGVDVDDVYHIDDILPASIKERYRIRVDPATTSGKEDDIHLGYFKLP